MRVATGGGREAGIGDSWDGLVTTDRGSGMGFDAGGGKGSFGTENANCMLQGTTPKRPPSKGGHGHDDAAIPESKAPAVGGL